MHPIANIVDELMLNLMPNIKKDALSKPFTPERSIIVDQIDFVTFQMEQGLSYSEAINLMRQS